MTEKQKPDEDGLYARGRKLSAQRKIMVRIASWTYARMRWFRVLMPNARKAVIKPIPNREIPKGSTSTEVGRNA